VPTVARGDSGVVSSLPPSGALQPGTAANAGAGACSSHPRDRVSVGGRGDSGVRTRADVAPGRTSSAPSPLPQGSFEELYRTHFRLVRRSLARLGVREADLMDVTQDVFVVVHRKLPSFGGRSNIATWLFAICKFVARDYVRSARFRREVLVDPGEVSDHFEQRLLDRSATKGQVVQGFGSPELAYDLRSILNRISEKLRIVFVLYAADGLSGEEIALILNIPVGTVRSRLRLAREALEQTSRARNRSSRRHDASSEAPGSAATSSDATSAACRLS
jgi:RNA polymerase sigma-70 factor, ECF subfamily